MKIIVTGAAGFIGSHLCTKLHRHKYEVIGIDSLIKLDDLKEYNLKLLKKHGIKVFKKDLAKDNIGEIIKDSDFIFHLAALTGLNGNGGYNDYYSNNVVATKNLLDQIKKSSENLKGLINVSTSSIYGAVAISEENSELNPVSEYGNTKLEAEELVWQAWEKDNIPACSIRPFSIYGPREREDKLISHMLNSHYSGKPFNLFANSLKHHRSFTFVDDLVDSLFKCIGKWEKCKGEAINIGNPESHSVETLISLLEKKLDSKIKFQIVPQRDGDQITTRANIDKARRLLDFFPRVGLESGLDSQIRWFRDYRNMNKQNLIIDK